MKNLRIKTTVPLVINLMACALTSVAAPAFAQQQTRATLEEVIVTAQRREESAQDVAISITTFSQDQLNNANMTNTSDLAQLTPSLSTNNRFGPENASFSIRGFTKEFRTTASVGVFFAEVVAPRGASNQDSGDGAGPGTMFDLQSVQVLKGPQGTLFGRNSTGGAILLVPNRPTEEFEGYVELSSGDFGLRQQQAVVNVPIHDRVKLRLGLDKKERDGYLNNFTDIGASELADVDYIAGRVSLVVDILDSLENYTVVNYADSETAGHTSRLFACNPSQDPSENPLFPFIQQPCQDQLARQRATGQGGFYDVASTVATPLVAIKDQRIVNTTTWDLSATLTIKNILAYSHLESKTGSDLFGTQFSETQGQLVSLGLPAGTADPRREFVPGVSVVDPNNPLTSQESWVEEIQVQGLSFDSRLDWQTGLYYESSQPDGFVGNRSAVLISCDLATLEGDPSQFNCFDSTGGQIGGVAEALFKTEYLSKAVYAQASYDIFQWLGVTVGARYTWDDVKGETVYSRHNFVFAAKQPAVVSAEKAEQSSEAPTGLFEIQYRPLSDVMIYGKYVRGYRQGSVNMSADVGLQTHEAEKVDTFEIGAKTSWEWLIPGRFNVAFFDNDFRNMQLQGGYISQDKGPTTAIFNAGKAEIRGFEAEALLQLYEGLTLSLSYSRLITELLEQEDNRAKVEEAAGFFAGQTFSPIADEGDELPFAPDKAYVAGLNYRLPLTESIGAIDMGVTYIHTGEQRAAASSVSPFAMLDEYSVVNVSLGWKAILGSSFDLSLFGTNVRDEEFLTYIHGSFRTLGIESGTGGMPRMYGARLKYDFGPF